MAAPDPLDQNEIAKPTRKFILRVDPIEMIDEALAAAGEYGVVSLVVEKGRRRFVRVERSLDVYKYEPGHLAGG